MPFEINKSIQKTMADLGEYMEDCNDLENHLHQFLLVQDEENGMSTVESVFDPSGDQKNNLENRQLV